MEFAVDTVGVEVAVAVACAVYVEEGVEGVEVVDRLVLVLESPVCNTQSITTHTH